MSLSGLSPTARLRCEDAWRDSEVTMTAMHSRFKLTKSDIVALNGRLGPKARGAHFSHRALCNQKRRAKKAMKTFSTMAVGR